MGSTSGHKSHSLWGLAGFRQDFQSAHKDGALLPGRSSLLNEENGCSKSSKIPTSWAAWCEDVGELRAAHRADFLIRDEGSVLSLCTTTHSHQNEEWYSKTEELASRAAVLCSSNHMIRIVLGVLERLSLRFGAGSRDPSLEAPNTPTNPKLFNLIVDPQKLESGLRTPSAGIPKTLLINDRGYWLGFYCNPYALNPKTVVSVTDL